MAQENKRTAQLLTGLQAAANIATLIAPCLLPVVLVKTCLLPSFVLPPAAKPAAVANASIGDNLNPQLSDVNFSSGNKTVLLALSTHCHFCAESARFYRQLSQKSGKSFRIVAVLPESVRESQDYLKREGAHVDQLRQMLLDKLGVSGTPTLFLVDKHGMVTKLWIGQLNDTEETQALKAILSAM